MSLSCFKLLSWNLYILLFHVQDTLSNFSLAGELVVQVMQVIQVMLVGRHPKLIRLFHLNKSFLNCRIC